MSRVEYLFRMIGPYLLAAPVYFSCQSKISSQSSTSVSTQELTPTTSQQFTGQESRTLGIESCHDGDTCRVLTSDGFWFNVRLAGIDAPEIGGRRKTNGNGQPLGLKARDELQRLVLRKTNLKIHQVDLDPFNRPIVEIFAGDDCINVKMLELGLAERYRGGAAVSEKNRYDSAEIAAKTSKLGIWGLGNYESPGLWRKRNKKQIKTN